MLYDVTNIPLETIGTVTEEDIIKAMSGCELSFNGAIQKKDMGTGSSTQIAPKLFSRRQFVGMGDSAPTLVTKTEDPAITAVYVSVRGFFYASTNYEYFENLGSYHLYYNSKTSKAVGFSKRVTDLNPDVQAFIADQDTKLVFALTLQQASDGGVLLIPNGKDGSSPRLTINYTHVDNQIRFSSTSPEVYGACTYATNTGYIYAPHVIMRKISNGTNGNNTVMNVFKDQALAAKLNEIDSKIAAVEDQVIKGLSKTASMFVSR